MNTNERKKHIAAGRKIEMVVLGPKKFSTFAADGKRRFAMPGETIMVSPTSAKAFGTQLIHPSVAHAQEAARLAVAEAADATRAIEEGKDPENDSDDDPENDENPKKDKNLKDKKQPSG